MADNAQKGMCVHTYVMYMYVQIRSYVHCNAMYVDKCTDF